MSGQDMEQLVVELAEHHRTRFFGKYRGIVTDVLTGKDLGKLRVRVPEIYDDQDSPIAWPCVPYAGNGHGLLLLPEIGDGVWVEFEAGDPSRPLWAGCWWGDDEIPDPKGANTRALITSGGLKIVVDDDGNKLQLVHPGGAEISLTEDGITLKYNASSITLSSDGVSVNDGALKIQAGG